MRAILFDRMGSPTEVLELADVPIPAVGDNDVLIRMIASSINPGDFLFIQGQYPEPKKPKLPRQIAGNHGAGVIAKAGKNVRIRIGSQVAFSYFGSWAEYAVIPSEWLIPLPPDFPKDKAGQFFNLITAWDLLVTSRAKTGDWLAITAGNSAVAIMLLQFARARGVRVIPIVRKSQIDLRGLGAAEVIALEGAGAEVRDKVMSITNGKGLNALIDNVGGSTTGDLIRSMSFGGQVVINGGMSPNRFELHNFDVLMSGIEIRSHVYRYFFEPPKTAHLEELAHIARLSAPSDFKTPIGGFNRLADFEIAVQQTLEHAELGKQFFDPQML
jgi:NADPH:quinone reductase-like Zn-dependent oxidoreductase